MNTFKKTTTAALCALFTACASVNSPAAKNTEGRQGWQWKTVNSVITIPLYPGQEGAEPGIRLEYRLLDLAGSEKEAQTVRKLLYDGGSPEKYRDKSGEALRNEYHGMRKNAETYPGMSDGPLNWHYTEVVERGAESPRYAVIRRSKDYYLGGAHGMRETEYFLIGRDEAGRIPLRELLREGAEAALLRLAGNEIRRYFDIPEGRPLSDVLFDNELEMQDNFFLSAGGLGFHWDPYEIAPYSAGPVELSVPWAQCADLLSEKGLRIMADFGFH
ncbi:MAG: RsiV family protein [Treponema sp.]|jgi:hypothetical protein|nr:RsiV family protein [Treponema sp.]